MKPNPGLSNEEFSAVPGHYAEFIVGMRVDVETYASATVRILAWARRGESRTVCAANVHMAMEAHDSAEFQRTVNGADLVTSDGVPLVWTLRARGFAQATRVYGPDLMLAVCAAAAAQGVPVAFFGGTDELLAALAAVLTRRFPALVIAVKIAPPFGEFSKEQNGNYASRLRASRAGIVFVGLGCPKQERWMAAMRGAVPAVFLGVGAAFAFHAGRVRQAPGWLQRAGLEWAFRLAVEPRRLWRRYFRHNPRFVWAAGRETWRTFRAGRRERSREPRSRNAHSP
jgi:N-acetylglucosaminyldiphosphoundecaprenol N-acetyl-beta-D-mannosaminyltransferase